jgi:hypothetical protein
MSCVQKGLDGILRHLERVHREYITKTDYLPKDPIIELQVTSLFFPFSGSRVMVPGVAQNSLSCLLTPRTGALFAYAQPTRACLAMKDLLSQQLEHMDRCIPPADLK